MTEDLDHIWKALADPTRRRILDFLKESPRLTGEIVKQFPEMSRFGVMKHVDVLRDAGLVNTISEGRKRINSLNAVPIRHIYERWVDGFSGFWASSLLDVKRDVESKS